LRRKEREVKGISDLVSIIEKCDVCTLVLHNEGIPYLLPLNFGYEVIDGVVHLFFHSAMEGTKFDIMKRDARASFEMHANHQLEYFEEQGYCTMSYESVIGTGKMHIIDNPQEKEKALRKIMDQYHEKDAYFNPAAIPRTKVYKLIVESMSGKSKPPRKTF
jgi:nitroimidazol reductase NimA-like FMN-containing flavoprotein (pyridoxamine 5'-phosphate oxidase superfamily)